VRPAARHRVCRSCPVSLITPEPACQGDNGSTFLNVRRYVEALRARGNTLLLVGVESRLQEQLERTRLVAVIGAANVFDVGVVTELTRAAVPVLNCSFSPAQRLR
jgi:hypothetical protein